MYSSHLEAEKLEGRGIKRRATKRKCSSDSGLEQYQEASYEKQRLQLHAFSLPHTAFRIMTKNIKTYTNSL